MVGVRGAGLWTDDRAGRQLRSGRQEVKLRTTMMTETSEAQEVISVFRPWDSQTEAQDTKPVLSPSQPSQPGLRPKQEPPVRPKLEPRETARPAVRPGVRPAVRASSVISPLSIAMRGLVPALPLPLPSRPHHPGLAHLSLLQRLQVQDLQDLQMAVALTEAGERKARPKKYKCDLCEACFSNNGQLRGHVRIHTGQSVSPAPM